MVTRNAHPLARFDSTLLREFLLICSAETNADEVSH